GRLRARAGTVRTYGVPRDVVGDSRGRRGVLVSTPQDRRTPGRRARANGRPPVAAVPVPLSHAAALDEDGARRHVPARAHPARRGGSADRPAVPVPAMPAVPD